MPKKATKQGRKDTTILLRIVILISFAIFPTRSHDILVLHGITGCYIVVELCGEFFFENTLV